MLWAAVKPPARCPPKPNESTIDKSSREMIQTFWFIPSML